MDTVHGAPLSHLLPGPRFMDRVHSIVHANLQYSPCLVPPQILKKCYSICHIECLRPVHGVLNVDEKKNLLHSLVENCETNVLSLISPCLNTIYQKKRMCYSSPKIQISRTKQGHITKICGRR